MSYPYQPTKAPCLLQRLLLAAAAIFAPVAAATPIDSTVVVEGTAIDTNPFDGNFETFVSINIGPEIRTFREARTLFEFSQGSLEQGDTVESAALSFTFDQVVSLSAVEVHAYAGDGVGSGSDVHTLNLIATILAPQVGVQTVDVTSAVQSLLDANEPYFGFFLRALAPENGGWARSDSTAALTGEFTRAAAVPEPGTLALISVAGIAGLGLRLSKRVTTAAS